MRLQILLLLIITSFVSTFGQNLKDSSDVSRDYADNIQELVIAVSGPEVVSVKDDPPLVTIQSTDGQGSPVSNVFLHIVSTGLDSLIGIPNKITTDSLGIADFLITEFKEKANYELMIYTANSRYESRPIAYKVRVRASNWVFIMIVGLLGGLSLFLFGMNLMSKGMQNSAGDQMRNFLNHITNNRFVAVGIGAFITTIIQSSSATNVMLVSFVNSRLLRFRQTVGIILGAAIGTTITAQIIAFKLTDYALLFVILGLFLQYISKRNQVRETGRAILGFGILFFGMHIMSEAMYPLRSFQPFIDVVIKMENPVLGILVGALFTALIQSSSAFIGILIILAMQGMLSLEASISLVIGANIGTAITALLASINTSREARQVAIAHTLIKAFGAIIFIFFIPLFTEVIERISQSVSEIATPREIANAHTIYNVVLCSIILPFTNSVAWFVNLIFPVREEEQKELVVKYIQDSLLEAPSMALKAAREELLRMMSEVQKMTKLIIKPFFEKQKHILLQIDSSEEKVNFLRDSITEFLIELTRSDISENNVTEAFILLHAVREYEEIADVISTQLKSKADRWCDTNYEFSEEGKSELENYHNLTLKILKKSILVYSALDIKQAKKLKEKYYTYRNEYFDLEHHHYRRLQENIEETVTSSKTHLELITLLKVICSHATNTARIIIRKKPKKKIRKKNERSKSKNK